MANTANQMTLQCYFSTASMKAAKRSFITSTTVNVILVALLTIIGASLIYYFTEGPEALPHSIDLSSGKDRDSILPLFVAAHLPPGLAGAVFAALLAAAMSTIDSGVNSFATVATVDFGRLPEQRREESNVFQARIITLLVGLLVTLAAIYLDMLTGVDDIPTMLSKNSTLWWEQWGDCSWPAC